MPATFPDISQSDEWIGVAPADIRALNDEGEKMVQEQIEGMEEAVKHDWPSFLKVSGQVSRKWIAEFDRFHDREKIIALLGRSKPEDFSNPYLIFCCEFGAALGMVLRHECPRLFWRYDWPYWDSLLVDPRSGNAVPVFHWAMKKMSEYGVDDGFDAKISACLQFMNEGRRING